MSRWDTFGLLEQTGLRLEGDRIRLKGMDRPVRLYPDRPLPEDARILCATFTRKACHRFLGLTFESADVVALAHAGGEPVGCDLGVEALLTLSNGERLPNVRPIPRREREIRISRQALARGKKGSARRKKVKAALARTLRKVANVRTTHLHQVSAKLTREHR